VENFITASEYRLSLQEAFCFSVDDPVAVSYRSMPIGPTPPEGALRRMPSIGLFVAWRGDCIEYRTLSGARYVEPLDTVYVSIPDADTCNDLRTRVRLDKERAARDEK
jgi:hypothetical protein